MSSVVRHPERDCWVDLGQEALDVAAATAWATVPSAGAVAAFLGVVRDHSADSGAVRAMTYEAYEEHARSRMRAVADDAMGRWPDCRRLVIWHRVGELDVSDVSVLVVASSPHRPTAFAAARHGIDAVKATVPIWKQEHGESGSRWVDECSGAGHVASEPVG